MQTEDEGAELKKYLKELAGQLWQSQLQRTLDSTTLQICLPTDCYNGKIENFHQLLDLLLQNKLVTTQDLSLLAELLGDEAHSLLRPLYEAGFGQSGLRPPSSRRGSAVSGSGFDRLAVPRPNAAPGLGMGGQPERDSPTTVRRSSSILKRMSSSRKGSDAAARMKARYTEFKSLLRDIGSKLNSDDISSLKFLCQDAVPRCQLEAVTTGLDLLTCLRKRRCITAKKTEFLYLILKDTGRLDLSHLVNSYYYLHLKNHLQDSQEDMLSSPTSDHDGGAAGISSGQVYHFHRSLKQVADKLVQSDLLSMKMICSCSACLPESKLEKAHTVCDLFALLEEKGKLSIDDISFLEELLADKLHLVHQLYDKGFGGKRNRTLSNQTQHFVQLLRTVGTQLTSADLQDLALLCDEEVEDLKSGMDLLMRLKRRQVITATNVMALKERLEEIGRNDLSVIVSQYKHLDRKDFTDGGGEEPCAPISPAPKRRVVTGSERGSSNMRTRELVGSSVTSIPCVTALTAAAATPMGSPAAMTRDMPLLLQDAMRKDQAVFSEELLQHQIDTLVKKMHSERLEHAHEKANLVGKLFEKGEECNQLLKHCFESDKARYRSEAEVAELNCLCQSLKDSTGALERELTENRASLERLEQTRGELELQLAREREDKNALKQAYSDKVMLLSKQLAKQEMLCIKLATSCGLQIHRARGHPSSTPV